MEAFTRPVIDSIDRDRRVITRRWVSVLLRGGGFRPCLVMEYRAPHGSERYTDIERSKDVYLSYRLAEAEAMEMAEDLNVQFRRWP